MSNFWGRVQLSSKNCCLAHMTPASTSAELLDSPFQCCVLPNFVSAAPPLGVGAAPDGVVDPETGEDGVSACPGGSGMEASGDEFLRRLAVELLKLKFYEKNNDLYQFRQVSL